MHSIVQTLQRRTILGLRGQLNAGYWTHLNANWFDFQCLKIEANGGLGGRQSITASLKRTQRFKLLCQSRIIQLIQLMFWYREILILLKWIIQRWQMIFATLCTCIYVIVLFLPENCKKENRNLNQHWASLVAFVRGTYCRHMLLVVGIAQCIDYDAKRKYFMPLWWREVLSWNLVRRMRSSTKYRQHGTLIRLS